MSYVSKKLGIIKCKKFMSKNEDLDILKNIEEYGY